MEQIILAAISDWLPTKIWQWVIIAICGGGIGFGLYMRKKQREAAGL